MWVSGVCVCVSGVWVSCVCVGKWCVIKWCVSKWCVGKLYVGNWCVSKLYVGKWCVGKQCVGELCVCVGKLCVSKLRVGKLFVCVSGVWVSCCVTRDGGRRRRKRRRKRTRSEQEPHTKMRGKMCGTCIDEKQWKKREWKIMESQCHFLLLSVIVPERLSTSIWISRRFMKGPGWELGTVAWFSWRRFQWFLRVSTGTHDILKITSPLEFPLKNQTTRVVSFRLIFDRLSLPVCMGTILENYVVETFFAILGP